MEGRFINDFNKLEAYAQELRDTNFGSDVVVNISKDALEQECKNFTCENNFTESFNKWILAVRAKPIIKMLGDIKIKVIGRLKDLKEEGE
ncbi:hypothetical protein CQW23_19180 [Capsicum baccatum]|uniref:Uncharacterized protein n=1 Tax=Capsicum baccatum TaxID=33114 RepID=A0A2G2W517_CAPBA|nr:hypothetical protein CQW23_19180 [Capsicum baccatum]